MDLSSNIFTVGRDTFINAGRYVLRQVHCVSLEGDTRAMGFGLGVIRSG